MRVHSNRAEVHMADRPREPQSYGSNQDWSSGATDQNVNDPKAAPPPQQEEFYSERRESEDTNDYQGGMTSPIQLAENQQQSGEGTAAESPVPKVNTHDGGAKRDSFFRKRDYGE
jgi:hypothetical protein